MPARLIINADDFGLTAGINRAIVELHVAGVVSSATLMATGPAFEDAVALALAHPGLGVGCHIVLVDGVPVSAPETVPSLLGPDGKRFRATLEAFIRDLFLGRIDAGEMEREALAQLQKLQRAGMDVTHLDTHKHTHVFPRVARVLVGLGNTTSVGRLRHPFDPAFAVAASSASLLRRAQLALMKRFRRSFDQVAGETLRPDGTLGIAATGTLTCPVLKGLLQSIPEDGLWELCCHPGYNDGALDEITTSLRATREIEREALLRIVPQMLSLPHAPQLIHYGSPGAFGVLRERGLFHPNGGYEPY